MFEQILVDCRKVEEDIVGERTICAIMHGIVNTDFDQAHQYFHIPAETLDTLDHIALWMVYGGEQ